LRHSNCTCSISAGSCVDGADEDSDGGVDEDSYGDIDEDSHGGITLFRQTCFGFGFDFMLTYSSFLMCSSSLSSLTCSISLICSSFLG
jgi:hypothetical protein